jgi:hypothetical protein
MPNAIVRIGAMCCRPGTRRRAINPTIRPRTIQLRRLLIFLAPHSTTGEKKADVAKYLPVFGHVGLLVNGLPGLARLLFI